MAAAEMSRVVVILIVTSLGVLMCAVGGEGSRYSGSGWGKGHATYYGGMDASGTQGMMRKNMCTSSTLYSEATVSYVVQ